MAIINNNLTNEEEHLGFTTSEADNDVFSIEQIGQYPGDIPDYNPTTFLNSMTENREEVKLFDDYSQQQNTSDNLQSIENIKNKDDFQEITDIPDIIENNKLEINDDNNDVEIENIDDIQMEQDNIVKTTVENDEINAQNENDENNQVVQDIVQEEFKSIEQPIVFDNDFLNLLKGDIDKKPIKSKINEIDEQAASEVIQYGDSIEVDTSQGDAELNVDLLSMKMETKIRNNEAINKEQEENNFDKLPELDIPAAPIEETQQIQTENIVDKNVVTENISNENEINTDNNEKYNSNVYKEKKVSKKNMTEEQEKQNNKKTFALIVAIVSVAMILIIGGVIGYLYLNNKQNIPTEPKITKQKDTTKQEQIAEHKDTTIADTNKIDTTKIDSVEKTVVENKIVPVPEENNIRKINNTSKPKVRQKSVEIKNKTEEPGSLYTIQIYSSPVKSDAEKHLSILNSKGISGYITQQNIKGKIWYRVRFGNYDRYDEAKYIVEKLSLKDAWIERVK